VVGDRRLGDAVSDGQLGVGDAFALDKVMVLKDAKLKLLAARLAVRTQVINGQGE
jgi:hypothetical protein